jgi:hypothetical protein
VIQEHVKEIPYFEYRAINQLVDAHRKIYGKQLRAVIAFGSLLTRGDTFDIDLLEVVDQYTGDRVAEFSSTTQLPLRGKLRLFFLATSEFEEAERLLDPGMREWVLNLLTRVRAGYEIIYQYPADFAERVIHSATSLATLTAPDSGVLQMTDPLTPPIKPPKRHRR